MKKLFIFAICTLSLYSCDISKKKLISKDQQKLFEKNNLINCQEIKKNSSNDKIKELGILSNLKVINGFKWLNFDNPLQYYNSCLSNLESFQDFITCNIYDFDFLDKVWKAHLIAYKGEIIKITLYVIHNPIAFSNSVRNDFIKLLGTPNVSELKILDKEQVKKTAYVITIYNTTNVIESINDIQLKLKNYHQHNSSEFTIEDYREAPIITSDNDPKFSNPFKHLKTIKVNFNYYSDISFEDVWENELILKCTYQRSSQLIVRSMYDIRRFKRTELPFSGYLFKNSWNTKIELYRNKESENLVKRLLEIKAQSKQKEAQEKQKAIDSEFINKF